MPTPDPHEDIREKLPRALQGAIDQWIHELARIHARFVGLDPSAAEQLLQRFRIKDPSMPLEFLRFLAAKHPKDWNPAELSEALDFMAQIHLPERN